MRKDLIRAHDRTVDEREATASGRVLAAAGARVTSMDLSNVQLELDRQVAEHDDLALRLEQGSMTDFSRLPAGHLT